MPDDPLPWAEVIFGSLPLLGLVFLASVWTASSGQRGEPALLVQLMRFMGWVYGGLYALLLFKYGLRPPTEETGGVVLFLGTFVPAVFLVSYLMSVTMLTVALHRMLRRYYAAGRCVRGMVETARVRRAALRLMWLDRIVNRDAPEPLSIVLESVCPRRRMLMAYERPA
jgi:hypothetical protein